MASTQTEEDTTWISWIEHKVAEDEHPSSAKGLIDKYHGLIDKYQSTWKVGNGLYSHSACTGKMSHSAPDECWGTEAPHSSRLTGGGRGSQCGIAGEDPHWSSAGVRGSSTPSASAGPPCEPIEEGSAHAVSLW